MVTAGSSDAQDNFNEALLFEVDQEMIIRIKKFTMDDAARWEIGEEMRNNTSTVITAPEHSTISTRSNEERTLNGAIVSAHSVSLFHRIRLSDGINHT